MATGVSWSMVLLCLSYTGGLGKFGLSRVVINNVNDEKKPMWWPPMIHSHAHSSLVSSVGVDDASNY